MNKAHKYWTKSPWTIASEGQVVTPQWLRATGPCHLCAHHLELEGCHCPTDFPFWAVTSLIEEVNIFFPF